MPSRRSVLRAAGTATASAVTASALAGCAALERGVDGYVQLKSITGVSEEDGHQNWDSLLKVTLSSPPGERPPDLSFVVDEWADRFDAPREPVVADALHDDLRRTFDEIRYVVGVCSPSWAEEGESVGCYNVSTTRENFNRVQVHDAVRASSDGTYLTIHSTDGKWTFDSE